MHGGGGWLLTKVQTAEGNQVGAGRLLIHGLLCDTVICLGHCLTGFSVPAMDNTLNWYSLNQGDLAHPRASLRK